MKFFRPGASQAKALLVACKLPVDDLDEAKLSHFLACGNEAHPDGVVGLELYGKVGLLRSLAVHEEARGRGCGKALVREAERRAAREGVEDLYLLTDTAEQFFAALGYANADRARAPEAIRATQQSATLCSASAVLMHKRLAG